MGVVVTTLDELVVADAVEMPRVVPYRLTVALAVERGGVGMVAIDGGHEGSGVPLASLVTFHCRFQLISTD